MGKASDNYALTQQISQALQSPVASVFDCFGFCRWLCSGLFGASDEPGEKTSDLAGERKAGLWQLGDEIAVLLALEGE